MSKRYILCEQIDAANHVRWKQNQICTYTVYSVNMHTWWWKALLTLLCQNAKHAPRQSYTDHMRSLSAFNFPFQNTALPLHWSHRHFLYFAHPTSWQILFWSVLNKRCSMLFRDVHNTDHHTQKICLVWGSTATRAFPLAGDWKRDKTCQQSSSLFNCKANSADFIFSWTCEICTKVWTAHNYSKQIETCASNIVSTEYTGWKK